MSIGFDNALGVHEDALRFRSQRSEILANNLANMDTPNYKARDIDFKTMLARASTPGPSIEMAATHAGHQRASGMADINSEPLYRVPSQPSIDGNTVDEHVEHSKYMENSLDFQATFTFLNSKFKGMTSALRGE